MQPTTSTFSQFRPGARWGLYWRWTLASSIGSVAAVVLYALLPDAVLRSSDTVSGAEYDPIWSYVFIYGAVYGPLSITQWYVLRRHVVDAWRWIVATVAGAAIVFPAALWILDSLGLGGFAKIIWQAGIDWETGLGGHFFAVGGQWLALQRWTRWGYFWPGLIHIYGYTATLGALTLLFYLNPWLGDYRDQYYFDFVLMLAFYYALNGILLAFLLGGSRSSKTTSPPKLEKLDDGEAVDPSRPFA